VEHPPGPHSVRLPEHDPDPPAVLLIPPLVEKSMSLVVAKQICPAQVDGKACCCALLSCVVSPFRATLVSAMMILGIQSSTHMPLVKILRQNFPSQHCRMLTAVQSMTGVRWAYRSFDTLRYTCPLTGGLAGTSRSGANAKKRITTFSPLHASLEVCGIQRRSHLPWLRRCRSRTQPPQGRR